MEIRKLRSFVNVALRHLSRFGTREDFLIVLEIASHQIDGNCLTLKQLVLWGAVPESTLKRRLARLVKLGHVTKAAANGDKRVYRYAVTDRTHQRLEQMTRDVRSYRWN